eukprot:TRINITY_DN3085_c0_g1_i1.p1 TRINITY_DN3085_c0_g1~~TRINITY_DN3085_c0_g1_i1.p1  ORF type:complete len:337 (+),score=114.15 TRINITY_DN3085_c0_g1_i1:29-1012(+)
MSSIIEVVILCALPASGKSEVRRFLSEIPPEEYRTRFHMGETVQLDDYPYVHLFRVIDDCLEKLNQPRIFFETADRCFIDGRFWLVLIELLNEDYLDVVRCKKLQRPEDLTHWLFVKIDAAMQRVGLSSKLTVLPINVREQLKDMLDEEISKYFEEKNNEIPETMQDKTIVIEFARGGPENSSFPIGNGQGYQATFQQFLPEIIKKAAALYIWVTPEESKQKNRDRADPNNPGSILNHGVPEYVMENDYGCDDIGHLRSISKVENCVPVTIGKETMSLPIGIFDNRGDFTTFLRSPTETWTDEQIYEVKSRIETAFDSIVQAYSKLH